MPSLGTANSGNRQVCHSLPDGRREMKSIPRGHHLPHDWWAQEGDEIHTQGAPPTTQLMDPGRWNPYPGGTTYHTTDGPREEMKSIPRGHHLPHDCWVQRWNPYPGGTTYHTTDGPREMKSIPRGHHPTTRLMGPERWNPYPGGTTYHTTDGPGRWNPYPGGTTYHKTDGPREMKSIPRGHHLPHDWWAQGDKIHTQGAPPTTRLGPREMKSIPRGHHLPHDCLLYWDPSPRTHVLFILTTLQAPLSRLLPRSATGTLQHRSLAWSRVVSWEKNSSDTGLVS